VTNPSGLLRYDGAKLQPVAAYPFSDPYGAAFDGTGNLYVSDRGSHQIVRIAPGGSVSIFAAPASRVSRATAGGDTGDAEWAFRRDGGCAGIVYIADTGNQRVRAVGRTEPSARLRLGCFGIRGDGATADFTSFKNPTAVAVDQQGNIFVADTATIVCVSCIAERDDAASDGGIERGVRWAEAFAGLAVFGLRILTGRRESAADCGDAVAAVARGDIGEYQRSSRTALLCERKSN